jgi:hypothetical protein
MGTLSNNENGTATLAPNNSNTDKTFSFSTWGSSFGFPLPNPIQGPNSSTLPPGTYAFSNGQVYTYTGFASQESWTEDKPWVATLNVANSYFELKIAGALFGIVAGQPDGSTQFRTPDNNGLNLNKWPIGPFPWSLFKVTLEKQYENFAAGEYDFSGGNPTLIKGKVAVAPGPEDPPSDWTASSQGFSK